jgi:hypothetical protein
VDVGDHKAFVAVDDENDHQIDCDASAHRQHWSGKVVPFAAAAVVVVAADKRPWPSLHYSASSTRTVKTMKKRNKYKEMLFH